MDSYITIHHSAAFEYEDRKSLFIGESCPAQKEEDAIAFIEHVKKKYPDANHHVYAYVIRDNSIMRFSDDHEPQGTAGMPVLDVIRKRGCTNVVIVVTRYFGGTLLGTGGLVRAYTACAQGALLGSEIITYDVYTELSLKCNYSDYQRLNSVFNEYSFTITDTHYSDHVEIVGKIVKANAEKLCYELTQLTSGRIETEILGEKYDFL